MAEIIAPQKRVSVTFSLEPAYNAIASLSLLDMAQDLSGLDDWVYRTKKTLTPEQLRTNQLVLQDVQVYLDDVSWSSFPEWLDDLAARDATEMRDQALAFWLAGVKKSVEGRPPTSSELLASRSAYLALAERSGGEQFDRSYWTEMHALLNDPQGRQQRIVSHLGEMWDRFLGPEWERCLARLEESIAAFETLDMSGLTAREAVSRVVLRAEIPEGLGWLATLEQIIFIPSAHAGPYLVHLGGLKDSVTRLVYGARIPEGASIRPPSLNRSELLMRLNALANDTRLSILELLGTTGELGTPAVVDQLALSQSAAARHLEHLTATGYLITRRHQGTNLFRVNPEQIDQTFAALKELCC